MSTELNEVRALYPGPDAAETGTAAPEGRKGRLRVNWRAVTAAAVALALLAVEGVIFTESLSGLVGFAHLIHIYGRDAYGVPITLDGVALIASLIALRAELAGESSLAARLAMVAFVAGSASANTWHGLRAGGIGAALYFGGMSLAVTVVFSLVLREIRHEDRRAAGTVTDRLPKFSAAHWGRYPRLTWRALSLAIRDGHTSPREAFTAARAAELPPLELDTVTLAGMAPRDRIITAFGAVGALDVPKALALLERSGCAVDQSHAYQVRRSLTRTDGAS